MMSGVFWSILGLFPVLMAKVPWTARTPLKEDEVTGWDSLAPHPGQYFRIVDENHSVRFFLTHFLISWCLLWEVLMVISVVLNFEDIMKCGQVFNLCMNLCRNVCLWARLEHLIIYSHDASWLNCIIVPKILSARLLSIFIVYSEDSERTWYLGRKGWFS